ncbi:DNA gyrase inhibitor YacG [Aestuariibacter sp. AA17]|uniref:DNA gyrase inhibitor YacG n=1 Tax=Fluctibacter corallii TaxID=2984329 RepID=A0ABT3A8C8_9ALTE|nr:DNA gyrase inhibitor YacG [Aestuariibacter sp. AA17]MCV2884914.1 DNA gyrase inhibitor YacG [Aestuariibacter sp. AA17]
MKVSCPTCQNDVEWTSNSEFRPFCSKRCQLIDLGEWAAEEKKISASSPVDAETEQATIDPEDIEALLIKLEQQH